MKTLRKTGFGSLPGVTDVGGSDGGSRWFMVARGDFSLFFLAAVDLLLLLPLLPWFPPPFFSIFLFFLTVFLSIFLKENFGHTYCVISVGLKAKDGRPYAREFLFIEIRALSRLSDSRDSNPIRISRTG